MIAKSPERNKVSSNVVANCPAISPPHAYLFGELWSTNGENRTGVSHKRRVLTRVATWHRLQQLHVVDFRLSERAAIRPGFATQFTESSRLEIRCKRVIYKQNALSYCIAVSLSLLLAVLSAIPIAMIVIGKIFYS